ncbi:MAG: hypothetical protein K2P17_03905 [Helicobacteraceae bacterium]|nr:hypothetical protein [Helicobacteraceae bacterium]
MKIDQKNIRVFHFLKGEKSEKIKQFIEKNYPILQAYLLLFDELDLELEECLKKHNLDFIKIKNLKLNKDKENTNILDSTLNSHTHKETSKLDFSNKTESSKNITPDKKNSSNKDLADSATFGNKINNKQSKTKVFKNLIRSGKNISHSDDIVIFNRVNSASSIKSDSNVCIYGDCDGDVECNGEYMILSKITKGKILFNGEIITPNTLQYKLNLITKENGKLKIQDILSL